MTRIRIATEDTKKQSKCSLQHLGLQHNVLLPFQPCIPKSSTGPEVLQAGLFGQSGLT